MLSIKNKFIPELKSSKHSKEKPIAITEAGDEAFYVTPSTAPKKKLKRKIPLKFAKYFDTDDYTDDEDDEDDDEDDEIFRKPIKKKMKTSSLLDYKPEKSFSGADWVPNFTDRLTMFIAGAPGAGKTYLAKKMINLLPKNLPILLFTALEENDGNFDDLGKERLYKIKMEPEVLSKIKLKAIREKAGTKQVILLFDDVDKIRNPKVKHLIFDIMNDALANGRGHEKHDGSGDIHVICTSHALNDYRNTKFTFENSNYIALFPGSTPPLQMERMFCDKLGQNKELLEKIMKLGRSQEIRSVIVHRVVPWYIIYGDKIQLL